MKKPGIQLLLSLAVLSTLFFASCQPQSPEQEEIEENPNFIFIITDDQTYKSINSLNNNEIITPNFDRLKDAGFTFTHSFNEGAWGGAVCVASRAMINSGQRLWHAREGVQTDSLWGQVFQAAGYETFLTGKWHNGDKTALKSFTKIQGLGRGMYETKQGMNGPRYRRVNWEEWHPADTSWGGQWKPTVKYGVRTDTSWTLTNFKKINQHSSEYFSDEAITYLENYDQDKPFFMYVSYTTPHDPKQIEQKYLDLYPIEDIKVPANYMDEHPFDQGHHAIRDEIIAPIPRTKEAIQMHRSEYYALITHTDEQIGRILNTLDKTGFTENTYIIFVSDHGLAVGMHGLMGKQNMYEHSVRMPFIIVGPEIEPGRMSDELVYMQSIFATTADLANIEVPSTVEYPSLVPILRGVGKGHEYIYGGYMHFQRMIRNNEYKMILYPHNGHYQLFNIAEDPDEINNIADDNPEIMSKMYDQLLIQQKQNGDTLPLEKYWEKQL